MKDLNKLIEFYNKNIEKYQDKSIDSEIDTDKAYFDGIVEGLRIALKELENVNLELDEKFKKLF